MAKWRRHAKAAAPTGVAVMTIETNRAGSLRMGQAPESSGAITRTIRGWAAPRSAQHVTTARQKRRKMPGTAVWSGVAHAGAPVKRPVVPLIAGIAMRQRPASVGEFSACLSVISGTTKCQMSGESRP
jgi:hypothetical protein